MGTGFTRALRILGPIMALGLLLMTAAPAFATELAQDTDPPIAADDPAFLGDELECADADIDEGEALWHFVLVDPNQATGSIDVTFEDENGDPYTVNVEFSKVAGNEMQFEVVTPDDHVLVGAETVGTLSGDRLNLSHTCVGDEPDTEIPEAPFAIILPGVLLAAFGGYLFLNRRRSTNLV